MRIKDLKRIYGSVGVEAWPPIWLSAQPASAPQNTHLTSTESVLERADRFGGRLTLTMRSSHGEHTGSLHWDEPPTAVEVEAVLMAHLGDPMCNVGDLEV